MDLLAAIPVKITGSVHGLPVHISLQAECIWSDGTLIIDAITAHDGPDPYIILGPSDNHLATLGAILGVDIMSECEHEARRWYRYNT
jgi:hypothetical protein